MNFSEELRARFPRLETEAHFSFARHTTIGLGGEAALAVGPASAEECALLLRFLEREKIPHCLLGAGANVLPRDDPFEGVVVRFRGLNALAEEDGFLFAGAGVTGGALCRFARARGLGGFEPLTGIPTTVGGGIAMNAGVREGRFSDVVAQVYGAEKGVLRRFSVEECEFGEKTSVFQTGIAVVGVLFRGTRRAPEEIEARVDAFRARRAHLPKGRSMGCVFVNPPGGSAGALIERCGLKGARVGGAVVSDVHADFILNEGGRSSDVEKLIALIRETVRRETGVALREEIKRLP